ncbi:MAG: hypothetical protein GF309_01495 [Candidatus Lokiarchaeota archaeon]|nr:hypothetical protein [Candidatus Lokiarchaeota archaeon]
MKTTILVGIYPSMLVVGTLVLVGISVALTFSKKSCTPDYLLWAIVRIPFFIFVWIVLDRLFIAVAFYPLSCIMSIFDTNLLLVLLSFLMTIALLLITEIINDTVLASPMRNR